MCQRAAVPTALTAAATFLKFVLLFLPRIGVCQPCTSQPALPNIQPLRFPKKLGKGRKNPELPQEAHRLLRTEAGS